MGIAVSVLAGCARAPRRDTPVAGEWAAEAERGAARLAPALHALHTRASALTRRPPRIDQCTANPVTRRYRRRPAAAVAWPSANARTAWMGDADGVVTWAIGARKPEPAALMGMDEAIDAWSRTADAALAGLERVLARVDAGTLEDLAGAEQIGPLPPGATDEEREAAKAESARQRRQYCQAAQRIPAHRIDAALAEVWLATRRLEMAAMLWPAALWPGDEPVRWTTAEGFHIVVGTPGADVVEEPWHLWLDSGGDDEVRADAPTQGRRLQVAVDLAGDDHYVAEGTGVAGAVGGLAVYIDGAGNDAYDGGRWSVGAAAFGGAILLDRAGDDAYAGRSASEAAALHGTALLLDAAGRDVYTVGVQGQAFAGPGGFGLLWDRAGHDTYTAGGVARDTDRDMGQFLSMAQGCAFGMRPDAEGGTALLLDAAGDDRYRGEVFAQGLGYWGGAGFLWDGGGNDTYSAVQYAQGTGLHFGVGVLRDDGGDDRYAAGGLAQGCGHDMAVGACVDVAGDDTYSARGLASGAGSAGGVGLFWDGAGDDEYVLSPLTNLGCDASTADRPGFALHVDAGGRDLFRLEGARDTSSAPARDGATWFTGRAGVAVNVPGPE